MSLRPLLRTARRHSGLTQTALAARLGVSQSAIAKLERPGADPRLSTIQRALRATGWELALSPTTTEVDATQIVERLALTPAQRLVAFQASQRNLDRLLADARRVEPGAR